MKKICLKSQKNLKFQFDSTQQKNERRANQLKKDEKSEREMIFATCRDLLVDLIYFLFFNTCNELKIHISLNVKGKD